MKEADLYREVREFLTSIGAEIIFKFRDVSRCVRCKTPQPAMAEKGTPDYLFFLQGAPAFIEVKYVKGNQFNFNQVGEEQWEFMLSRAKHIPCFVWLGYEGNSVNSRTFPRRTFLVPIERLKEYRMILEQRGLKSLPLYAEDYNRKAAKKGGWDANTLLADYELTWRDGKWTALTHPFFAENPVKRSVQMRMV